MRDLWMLRPATTGVDDSALTQVFYPDETFAATANEVARVLGDPTGCRPRRYGRRGGRRHCCRRRSCRRVRLNVRRFPTSL